MLASRTSKAGSQPATNSIVITTSSDPPKPDLLSDTHLHPPGQLSCRNRSV